MQLVVCLDVLENMGNYIHLPDEMPFGKSKLFVSFQGRDNFCDQMEFSNSSSLVAVSFMDCLAF